MYIPSLPVTGFNLYMVGLIVCVVCLFYTILVSGQTPLKSFFINCYNNSHTPSGWNKSGSVHGRLASDGHVPEHGGDYHPWHDPIGGFQCDIQKSS